jgi:hypothetical protein
MPEATITTHDLDLAAAALAHLVDDVDASIERVSIHYAGDADAGQLARAELSSLRDRAQRTAARLTGISRAAQGRATRQASEL